MGTTTEVENKKSNAKIIAIVIVLLLLIIVIVVVYYYMFKKTEYVYIACDIDGNIQFSAEKPIEIISAVYGRKDTTTCKQQGINNKYFDDRFYQNTNCELDVTKLFMQYNGKKEVNQTWNSFYNSINNRRPCQGTYRYLTIKYRA